MDKILHDPKDPKLWELWYIPYNGYYNNVGTCLRNLGPLLGLPCMNPIILGVFGPGFLNQIPTLGSGLKSRNSRSPSSPKTLTV